MDTSIWDDEHDKVKIVYQDDHIPMQLPQEVAAGPGTNAVLRRRECADLWGTGIACYAGRTFDLRERFAEAHVQGVILRNIA